MAFAQWPEVLAGIRWIVVGRPLLAIGQKKGPPFSLMLLDVRFCT